MRVLLDTNVLLWVVTEPARLSQDTQTFVRDRSNDVMFSAVSIWEIAIKFGLRRVDFRVDPRSVAKEARDGGFRELPLTASVAAMVDTLPAFHRDPFDRLLIAQAIAVSARLLTADQTLARYSELVTIVRRPA